MDLREMQAQRETLCARAREAFEEIRKNTDEARAAELEARHDTIMGELDQLDERIERELRHEATLSRMESRFEQRDREEREGRRPGGNGSAPGEDRGDESGLTYAQAFQSYLLNRGQLGAMTPEERTILQAGYQTIEPNAEQRAQTTTTTEGGYTIPTEVMPRLIETMATFGPMLDPSWTQEFVTSTGVTMTMPTVDDVANESTIVQHGEGVTLTDDGGVDAVFGQKSLEAYAYNTEWIRLDLALIQDSVLNMTNVIAMLLGKRLGRKGNTLLTTGDGTGDPNGIITAASTGVTAASATAIKFDELMDLEGSIDSAYADSPNAGFMFKRSTLTALRKLKDGEGRYIWQMGNVQGGVPNMLNGKPYRENPAMAAIATGNKTIAFGDMKAYFVRKVGQPLIGAIQDKDFWPGVGVAGYWRIDGELSDTSAVKVLAQA